MSVAPDPASALEIARDHHRAGRLAEAEPLYRALLAQDPGHTEATLLLGLLADQAGHADAAFSLLIRSAELMPAGPEFYRQLAQAIGRLGRYAGPSAAVFGKLGMTFQSRGRLDEAIECYRRTLVLDPQQAGVWNNLSVALRSVGRAVEAADAARHTIQLSPRLAVAHENLGVAMTLAGQVAEAIDPLYRAAELEPARATSWFYLGNVLHLLHRHEEAIGMYQRALSLNPQNPDALTNLASMLHATGRVVEALDADKRAISLSRDPARAHSRMLFTVNFLARYEPKEVFAAHRGWATRYADPITSQSPTPVLGSTQDRRLRIGYVSPDFAQHAVATFFEPLLAAHDRERFEVFCYCNGIQHDATTERLMMLSEHWREIDQLDDVAAAQLVREDQIDVLVDLAGHTDRNRLLLFARRPASVQVTYLGYPNTTGMRAIDLRITDVIADPEGESDVLHSERLIRLPRTAWCYRTSDAALDVSPSPSDTAGFVTFGSFNTLAKINETMLELWARIMHGAEDSRLLIKAVGLSEAATRQRLLDAIMAHGVPANRVQIVAPTDSLAEHFAMYGQVDISLDTSPYNGTTTTCDALFMGAPVIASRGDRHASRVSASLLSAVGLDDLIAESAEEYVARAVELAQDAGRRRKLRASLRDRMQSSPLMDAAGLARAVEQVFWDAVRG